MRSNDQLGWTFVTEAEAMDQVESGKAYAAIIIPKTFRRSRRRGDRRQESAHSGVLRQRKSQRHRPQVTDVGASTVDRTVNSTFVSTVSEVLTEVINTVDGKAISTEDTTKAKALTALAKAPTMCSTHAAPSPSSPPNSPTPQSRHAPHVRRWTTRAHLASTLQKVWPRLHPDRHYPDQSERLRHLHVRSA